MKVPSLFKQSGNILFWVVLAIAALLIYLPYTLNNEPAPYHAAALLLVAVTLWSTHKLPEHVTALVLMLGAVLMAVAPPLTAFSGFGSGGTWLTFGGLVIGAAISNAGLDKRLVNTFLTRIDLNYGSVVVILMILSFVLAIIIPSTIPRILMLMPIALALAERMGFTIGSRGANGIALTVGVGSFFPSWSLLPANLPVVVHAGAIETVYGVTQTYGEHFAFHFPVMGLLRGILCGVILYFLFRTQTKTVRHKSKLQPLDAKGRRLLWLLTLTLGFWFTDFWHGIAPGWIALGAAIIILSPYSSMLPKDAFHSKLNLGPVFYIAGVLSIGAIVSDTGLDKLLAGLVIDFLQFKKGDDVINYGLVLVLGLCSSLAMTAPGAPALTVPLAQALADATGMPMSTVLMIGLTGQSLVLFPYAAPPIVVAVIVGGVRVIDAVKIMFLTSIATAIILGPIQFFYWDAIGLFEGVN